MTCENRKLLLYYEKAKNTFPKKHPYHLIKMTYENNINKHK